MERIYTDEQLYLQVRRLNAIMNAPFSDWQSHTARKQHTDEFGVVISEGEEYFSRQSAVWGWREKWSIPSMERVLFGIQSVSISRTVKRRSPRASGVVWTKVKLNRSQSVLTKKEMAALPALYSQDGKGENAIAYVHFFYGPYDLWATEFNPETGEFFGLVSLHEKELGYVYAEELILMGRIERDLYWTPKPLSQCNP